MSQTRTWPAHWASVPMWSMFERVKDTGHPDEELLSVYRDHGVVAKNSRTDNLNKTAENRDIYQLVGPGWLVVNRMKAFQGSVGISGQHGIVSGHYICFRPRHDANPRFLNWLLRSSPYTWEYQRISRGVRPNQIEIDNDGLRVLPIRLPDRPEQAAIADFLDRETAKIDALIAKQEQLVRLGNERVDAAWAQTVDELARRNRVVPLRRIVSSIADGPFGSSLTSAHYSEHGARVIRLGNVGINEFKDEDRAYIPLDYAAELTHTRWRPATSLLRV